MSNTGDLTLGDQSSTQALKPLRTRTILVVCALGAALFAHLVCGVVGYMQLSLLNRVAAGGGITKAEATANDLRYSGAYLFMVAMLVISAVFLFMWMYRANANCRPLARGPLRFTPGGAVGWWFCPILNLVRPYQIMKEILSVSTSSLGRRSVAIVGLWWTFWILANIASRVGAAVSSAGSDSSPKIDSLITATWANMVDIPLYLIAGLLLILIIRQVDDAQERQRNISMEPVPLPTA